MSAYPPDNMEFTTDGNAAWGTDADISTSVYYSGDCSVHFKNTTPTGTWAVVGTPVDKAVEVSPGDLIMMEGWVRANQNAADDKPYMSMRFYDAAKAFVSSTDAYNAPVTTVDTWEKKTGVITVPAGCYWAAKTCGKILGAATSANVYWDSVFAYPIKEAFEAWRTVDSSHTSGTLAFSNETFDYGGCFSTSTYKFTAPCPGIYAFSGYVASSDTAAGEAWWIKLKIGGATKSYDYRVVHTAGDGIAMNVSASHVLMAAGATAEITLDFDGGGSNVISSALFFGGRL